MFLRILLCLALLAPAASAQWPRYVSALKSYDSGPDTPAAHPLSYFQMDPRSRPDDESLVRMLDLCGVCGTRVPPPSPADIEERAKTHTNLRLVGKIGTFTVYDLEYFFIAYAPDEGPHMKSVLVEVDPGQFQEIYVEQQATPLAKLFPSYIEAAGSQNVLGASSTDGGNDGFTFEKYFAFSERGARMIDPQPIVSAANSLIPNGTSLSGDRFDFATLKWTATAGSGAKVFFQLAGIVTVNFRLYQSRIVVTGATFEPSK